MSNIYSDRSFCRALVSIVGLSILVKGYLAMTYSINWDELFFLSKIYQYERGELVSVFQTFYVHFFSWLIYIPLDEIGQVQVGRVVMLFCHIVTLYYLYKSGKILLDKDSALFSVAMYATFSLVITQGMSFRADPIISLLISYAIYILLENKFNSISFVKLAAATAVVLMVSVKSILYFPVFVFIGLSRIFFPCFDGRKALYYFSLSVASLVFFLGLYFLNASLIGGDVEATASRASSVYVSTLGGDGFFPQLGVLQNAIVRNVFFCIFVFFGALMMMFVWCKNSGFLEREYLVLSLALPFSAVIFYRNSYGYFYPFLLMGVSILIGYSWFMIRRVDFNNRILGQFFIFLVVILVSLVCDFIYYIIPNFIPAIVFLAIIFLSLSGENRNYYIGYFLPIILLASASWNLVRDGIMHEGERQLDYQKQILWVVRKMFPSPVPYIDGSSFVSSYPKIGFFMSVWNISDYMEEGTSEFPKLIDTEEPVFLLANTSTKKIKRIMEGEDILLPEDNIVLRENYFQHWGPIYIAGKKIQLEAGREVYSNFAISGIYTLESPGSLVLDGKIINIGESVLVKKGIRKISNLSHDKNIVFRYGKDIFKPDFEPLGEKLYSGF